MRQTAICAVAALLLAGAAVIRWHTPPPPEGIVRAQLEIRDPSGYSIVDPHEDAGIDAAYHEHFMKDGREIAVTVRHLGYAHRLDVCYRLSGWLISQAQPAQVSNRGWGTSFVAHGPTRQNVACTEVPIRQDGSPALEAKPSLIDYSFAKGVRTLEVCQQFPQEKEQAVSLESVEQFTREFLANQKIAESKTQ